MDEFKANIKTLKKKKVNNPINVDVARLDLQLRSLKSKTNEK